MVGGKKIDIIKLAQQRDDALKKANVHFVKMRDLENKAENIDSFITEHCNHPKKYLKLKNFSDTTTFWLCTICFQTTCLDQPSKNKKRDQAIKDMFDDIMEEIPCEWAHPPKE